MVFTGCLYIMCLGTFIFFFFFLLFVVIFPLLIDLLFGMIPTACVWNMIKVPILAIVLLVLV